MVTYIVPIIICNLMSITRPIILNCTVICVELMDIFECILAVALPPLFVDLSLLQRLQVATGPSSKGSICVTIVFFEHCVQIFG